MATMQVKELILENPPLEITLKLNLQEAAIIQAMCGCIARPGELRSFAENIYYTLQKNKRVDEMAGDLVTNIKVECCGCFPIGGIELPKED